LVELLPLDFKNKLTHYLEMAQKGHNVIITDRGAPVAVMHNLDEVRKKPGPRSSRLILPVRVFSPYRRSGENRHLRLLKERRQKVNAVALRPKSVNSHPIHPHPSSRRRL